MEPASYLCIRQLALLLADVAAPQDDFASTRVGAADIHWGMDIASFAAQLSSWVWGVPLIVLLFGTHLFLTFRTGFIQRYVFRGIRISSSRKADGPGDVSQFGALMTALAATVGAGNIVYALERGLGMKWLGVIFAVFTCIAAFGIGNMFRANSVVDVLRRGAELGWVSPRIRAEFR